MLGGSKSMVFASMWASMAAWCTPTILFVTINLIIATIFIASKSNDTKHNDNLQRNSFSPIARVSSFLERAKSVNLSSCTTTAAGAVESPQSKPATYSSLSRLAQSIHFPSSNGTRIPLRSSVSSPPEFSTGGDNTFQTESEQICNSPGQLVRAPSLLDRIKSFKISSAFKPGVPSTQPEIFDTEPAHNPEHHVVKGKSEKTSAAKKPPVEMKKSRSEMRITSDEDEDVDVRLPATARARRKADNAEFDLKADDFISRFKQQLNLQRVESLVRFRDMLNRGT